MQASKPPTGRFYLDPLRSWPCFGGLHNVFLRFALSVRRCSSFGYSWEAGADISGQSAQAQDSEQLYRSAGCPGCLILACDAGIPVVPIKGIHGTVDFPLLGIGTWQYNSTVAKDRLSCALYM